MNIKVPHPETTCFTIAEPFQQSLVLMAQTNVSKASLETWHHHLGHLSFNLVLQMVNKGMVKGMELTGRAQSKFPCKPYLKGKQTWAEINKVAEECLDVVLRCIHSDVSGYMPTCSHFRYKYYILFIGDKYWKLFVAGLRWKSEVLYHFKVFLAGWHMLGWKPAENFKLSTLMEGVNMTVRK
jgi:GAG-pre-integrase domain